MQATLSRPAPSFQPWTWFFGRSVQRAPAPRARPRHPAWAPTQTLVQTQTLRKGETLVVPEPQGCMVSCSGAALWITHDNVPVDHIIEPGVHYIAKEQTRMLLHALGDCSVQMVSG